jgi:predicted DNA-binding transcriptional regulator AlpA
MKAVLTADGDRRARALQVLETGKSDTLPDPLLTINQLCQRLQVSRATLWRWRLPCIRRGGVRRYQWGEVLAAIEKNPDKPGAKGGRK